MSYSVQVRDAVHGFIRWHGRDKLVDIIDTSAFQRLRRIKQCALASYVYPGAVHTRFEHSLGVYHVASRLAEKMGVSGESLEIVLRAALLHDIGHGPFSHVSENILDQFYDQAKIQPTDKEKIHEMVSHDVIRFDSSLGRCLLPRERDQVVALLRDGYEDPVHKEIVSGPLDADKMDYLLRDSLFCGVQYGVYDLDQLVSSLVATGEPGERTLMIDEDGVHAVEQFVLAKYYITSQVYFHKIRLITDQMLTRAIIEGIRTDGIDELRKLYSYDGTPEFIERYLQWDDERLLREYTSRVYDGKRVKDIFDRLRERDLYKRLYHRPLSQISPAELRLKLSNVKPGDTLLRDAEQALAEELDKSNYEVIVNLVDVKNVKHMASESQVMVKGTDRTFQEESALFDSINLKYSEKYIDCYAPIEFKDRSDKLRRTKDFERVFDEVLSRVFCEKQRGEISEPQHE